MTDPSPPKKKASSRAKNWTLGILLSAISIIGPLVAYASVTVIWPTSTHTVNVDTTPVMTIASGADYTTAVNAGFLASFTATENSAAFTLTVSGLSGGTIEVDEYLAITMGSAVASYKVQVAAAQSGTLDSTEITTLKIRLWTGDTAPTADGSTGVCAVLDLESAVDTESSASCTATTKVQIVYTLAASAAGSNTVGVRLSSITFA